ncbi:hypothetical protein TVAG_327990 [Trichomonas vaginalis G3]|uniref:Uncharacterized protein n=1 Tax=Trichomonas vaginalis (strain ATCC PRA-98 / G3) TaxID=412133 RepID=A2FKX2_TRIV3|nr:hypothetical protein TVAGG3_0310980 [Trichomonas vaginalis G3]EAX94456.1 hypothetical protein TVAG_327990 [Trichomonas vaginalis G3]KAI5528603.1 hypothetical protein TVAGG3_0310980 [Trichomonas vaginalis G3]|eukprot:XP_001307386.1 hypothetical protein [Trichomonas vaginalis G3]
MPSSSSASELKTALNALSSEMDFQGGGWHMQNITIIRNSAEKFKFADMRAFIGEIVGFMRRPDASCTNKFKLAQLLNLLKSFQVRGFEEVVLEFRNQILNSYIFLGDQQLGEAALGMINNLWNMPNVIRPVVKTASKLPRIKINTPSANVIRKIFMASIPYLADPIRHASPPPYVE